MIFFFFLGAPIPYAFFIKFHIPIDLWYLNFTLITLRAWIIPINTYFSLWLSSLDLSWSSTCIYGTLPNKHKWEIVGFFLLQACYVGFFLVQSLCETKMSQIDYMRRFIPNFFGHSHALLHSFGHVTTYHYLPYMLGFEKHLHSDIPIINKYKKLVTHENKKCCHLARKMSFSPRIY